MSTRPFDDANRGFPERKRTRMVRPYPIHTLEDALTIAAAIQESNAGLPFDRVLLARALGTTPASSGFTMKLNSSAKYGLTEGGYSDALISLTRLGEAIVAPRGDDEYRQALIEAAINPDVFGRFYRLLNGKRLPEDTYAQNMLQREFGVHPDIVGECLGIIKANGLHTGILSETEGYLYITLGTLKESGLPREHEGEGQGAIPKTSGVGGVHTRPHQVLAPCGKIFIGYSGNASVVPFVKTLLDDFGIPHGSVEEDGDDSQPVSVQVSSEMRGCTSAILIFARNGNNNADEKMIYQLGAASVLYGDKVVVMREYGLELAHHVPDIHRVNFAGERLEEAGLALLRELHRAGAIRVSV